MWTKRTVQGIKLILNRSKRKGYRFAFTSSTLGIWLRHRAQDKGLLCKLWKP